MKKKILVASMMVALASGCQTIDPYTGEQKVGNTTKGAGIGAVAGAVLGAAVSSKGDREKGILTGALVGGAVGGGIGYYMDQQEALLRQELQGTGVQVERRGDEIRLIMPGNITFATGSEMLESSFLPVLNSVAKVLKKFDQTLLQIDGYTDSQGGFEYNQQLSERRAYSVQSYLAGVGVANTRLQSRGWGERYPVADNATAQGRAQNRRVELNIRGNAG
ncbi:OmpA family protein [Motiliproteus coralliicola]|nr:OmpA family protein [Motiliproteus coralliicola]